jgi:hypothetical protein
MGVVSTVNDEGGEGAEVWVWPEDPRSWDILGDPDDALRSYRTFRTYLVRWHRWTCDWGKISHFDGHSDVHLTDGVILRAFGRIITDDGEDVTAKFVRSTSEPGGNRGR